MAKIETTVSKISSDVQRFWENNGIADHASKREFQYFRIDGTEKPVAPIISNILSQLAKLADVVGAAPVDEKAKGRAVASIQAVTADDVLQLAYANMRGQHLEGLFASGALPRPPAKVATPSAPVETVSNW